MVNIIHLQNNTLQIEGQTFEIPTQTGIIKQQWPHMNSMLSAIEKMALFIGTRTIYLHDEKEDTKTLKVLSIPFVRDNGGIIEALDFVYHDNRIAECHVRRIIERKTYSLGACYMEAKQSVATVSIVNIKNKPLDKKTNMVRYFDILWFHKTETLCWCPVEHPVQLNKLQSWYKVAPLEKGMVSFQRPIIYNDTPYLITISGYVEGSTLNIQARKTYKPN